MRELGMVVMGCLIFLGFFSTVIYPDLEYKGYSSVQNCSGECYEEYVRIHGSVVDQLKEKAERDLADPFSSIRGLWSGCAACHGQSGEGMGAFPKLAGQNSDYIIQRLTQYKNSETVGQMSATMWAQAGQLSQEDIEILGEFIQETMK